MRPGSYRIRWNNANLGLLCRSRSFKVTEFGTNRKLICDFLLVVNSNLYHILHRFRDIAFERSKIAIYLAIPLRLSPPRPTEGFPWDDLRKSLRGCQWMAKVPNGVETLPKISTVCVGTRYRRQTTDGFATIANVNVNSRWLKIESCAVRFRNANKNK